MAWNIGKIKKDLAGGDIKKLLMKAELFEFTNEKDNAIKAYTEYIFYLKRSDLPPEQKK